MAVIAPTICCSSCLTREVGSVTRSRRSQLCFQFTEVLAGVSVGLAVGTSVVCSLSSWWNGKHCQSDNGGARRNPKRALRDVPLCRKSRSSSFRMRSLACWRDLWCAKLNASIECSACKRHLYAPFDGTSAPGLEFQIRELLQCGKEAQVVGGSISDRLIQMVAHRRQAELFEFLGECAHRSRSFREPRLVHDRPLACAGDRGRGCQPGPERMLGIATGVESHSARVILHDQRDRIPRCESRADRTVALFKGWVQGLLGRAPDIRIYLKTCGPICNSHGAKTRNGTWTKARIGILSQPDNADSHSKFGIVAEWIGFSYGLIPGKPSELILLTLSLSFLGLPA